jgi:outer membrane immunogenic protein
MRQSTAMWVAVASVAFLSVCSMASAADLPRPAYKAPPLFAPAPVFSWTGFYVGGHVGYGWSQFDGTGTFDSEVVTDTVNANGFLAGGQVGYNYQFGQFVLGVEGEFSWANVKYDTALFGGTLTLKNDYFATAAARFGYAFDRFMVYGKVGGAWTRDKWDGDDGIGGTVTGTFNRTGWVFGVGLEYAFWNNLSAKLEYNYLMFPSISPTLTTSGTLSTEGTSDIKLNTHLVKLGLNYRFNWP